MSAAQYQCPRCGSQLNKLAVERRPLFQELAFLGVGDLIVALATGLLVLIGFVHWLAWFLALGAVIWWGLRLNERRSRYSCASCGITFPRDMVLVV